MTTLRRSTDAKARVLSVRHVDTVTHELTTPQLLAALLLLFRESLTLPVTISVRDGEKDACVKKLRSELSRLRKNYANNGEQVAYFGLDVSGSIKVKNQTGALEFFAVSYHLTKIQQVKNMLATNTLEL